MSKKYRVAGDKKFQCKAFNTADTGSFKNREEAEKELTANKEKIVALQEKLYAEKKEGFVFIFQAMDAAGKDGTIKAVLDCLSPHGVKEASFKTPSKTELAHDYLWRIAAQLPEKGEIAIFNRSHYEDVLVGKVHKLYENYAWADRIDRDKIISNRYKDIRHFEEYLYHNSIRVVKIFLNVSKEEQAKRFLSRLEEKEKNWKFSIGDMKERQYWEEYQRAFEDAINRTATDHCPWYIVPADHKWYMRWLVSKILLDNLEEAHPHWPNVQAGDLAQFADCEKELKAELGTKDIPEIEELAQR